jgi:hypothetical protein
MGLIKLGWSETEKGYILSAFYIGYATGQIPATKLAMKYDDFILSFLMIFDV